MFLKKMCYLRKQNSKFSINYFFLCFQCVQRFSVENYKPQLILFIRHSKIIYGPRIFKMCA
jgi:hypothetical protein